MKKLASVLLLLLTPLASQAALTLGSTTGVYKDPNTTMLDGMIYKNYFIAGNIGSATTPAANSTELFDLFSVECPRASAINYAIHYSIRVDRFVSSRPPSGNLPYIVFTMPHGSTTTKFTNWGAYSVQQSYELQDSVKAADRTFTILIAKPPTTIPTLFDYKIYIGCIADRIDNHSFDLTPVSITRNINQ